MRKNVLIVFLIILFLSLGTIFIFRNYLKKDNNKQTDINNVSFEFIKDEYIAKNEENNTKFINKIKYPKVIINTDTEVAEKISNSLKQEAEKIWFSINQTADQTVTELKDRQDLELDVTINKAMVNDNVMTFTGVLSGNAGGVSWNQIYEYIYDIKTGEKINLEDILTNVLELRKNIYLYAVEYLESQKDLYLIDNWREELKNIIDNMNNSTEENISWNLVGDGLDITIAKYAIAPGVAGPISITIPYSKINDYLKAEYKG